MNVVRVLSDRTAWPTVRHLLLEALILCLAGLFFGVLIHHQLLWKVITGQPFAPIPATLQAMRPGEVFLVPAALEEVRDMIRQGAVLVDARSRELFRESHIAGAVSLPLGQAEEEIPSFRNRVSLTTPVIVYCSGYGCRDSDDLGAKLIEAGYGEVLVYEGGFPEWREAGLPVGKGD